MFGRSKCEVLVAGAGPVGLMTAVLLAERGIDTAIIDRERRTNLHSYALVLHGETLRLLDDIGLAKGLITQGYKIERVVFREPEEKKLTLDIADAGGRYPYVLVVPQSLLEETLAKRLAELEVPIHWQHELVEIEHSDGAEIAHVHEVGEVPQGYPIMETHRMVLGRKKVSARFVVGADGFHSVTRRFIGSQYEVRGKSHFYSVFEFPTKKDLAGEAHIVATGNKVSILWPMAGETCRWSFEIDDPREHAPEAAKLQEFVRNRASWFGSGPYDLNWSACVRFEKRLVDSYGKDSVWLAGDAAHLTTPIGAQSMNIGMREAYTLACMIFDILRNGVPQTKLCAYNDLFRNEWNLLLGNELRQIGFLPHAGDWVKSHIRLLATSLPASGAELTALMEKAGLKTT